jgi:Spy/CpxP family protein refolding chaperone
MFNSRFRRRASQAVLASALFVAIGAAAQPGPGAGPGPGFGPHARGAHVEQVIAQLRTQLNLNTQQQLAFDNAIAASKSARGAGRAERDKVRDAMKVELAKPAPDLRAISNLAETARANTHAQHTQIREQWLALYETFTSQQKQVVRDAMLKRMERMEQFREKMRERFGG